MSIAIDLDPIFVRALKLLQSKAKDSGVQLKAMLDDAVAQRKGLKIPSQSGDAEKSASSRSRNDDDTKKREMDKRSADKSVKDPSEPDHKKTKLDPSKQKSSEREARDKEKERERSKREREKKEKEEKEAQRLKDKAEKERKEKESISAKQITEIEIPSDEEEQTSQMDAGDFALEMGIACVVCRQFDVSSGNQLVECQECRSLYHQECHKPSVTGEDVSDPRFVWYCSKCTKSFKKMVTQKPSKPKPSLPVISTKESTTAISKPLKSESTVSSQAFRKIDPKAIVTAKEIPMSSTTKPMVGLEGLAANLVKPRGEAKHSVSQKKTDQRGESGKSSTKGDGKSSSSSKQDNPSKDNPSKTSSSSSSSSKSENRKSDSSKSSGKEEKEKDRKSEAKVKTDEKRSGESSSKSSSSSSSSSSSKDEKKSDSKLSSSEKKSDSGKSPSQSASSKTENSNNSPPPSSSTSPTPETPPSKGNNSNKQAVANLSMVTANKRIQMMKKKAQAKPQEKKVHIK